MIRHFFFDINILIIQKERLMDNRTKGLGYKTYLAKIACIIIRFSLLLKKNLVCVNCLSSKLWGIFWGEI